MGVPSETHVKRPSASDNEPPSPRDLWPVREPSGGGRSVTDDVMDDDAMVSTVAELRKRVQ